jgi:hypothetical protein
MTKTLEEIKRMLLEEYLEYVIEEGFEVVNKNGDGIRKNTDFYTVYIEGENVFGCRYKTVQEAVKRFLLHG